MTWEELEGGRPEYPQSVVFIMTSFSFLQWPLFITKRKRFYCCHFVLLLIKERGYIYLWVKKQVLRMS